MCSFCTERSGHFDAFDQGLIFFLPNMTWGQPPFYVHKMVKDSWLPWAVSVTGTVPNINQAVSAATSADGSQLTVRIVNVGSAMVRTLVSAAKAAARYQLMPAAHVMCLRLDCPLLRVFCLCFCAMYWVPLWASLLQPLAVDVQGLKVLGSPVTTTCFANSDPTAANTPSDPTAVSPSAPVKSSWAGTIDLPANSFCTLQFGQA